MVADKWPKLSELRVFRAGIRLGLSIGINIRLEVEVRLRVIRGKLAGLQRRTREGMRRRLRGGMWGGMWGEKWGGGELDADGAVGIFEIAYVGISPEVDPLSDDGMSEVAEMGFVGVGIDGRVTDLPADDAEWAYADRSAYLGVWGDGGMGSDVAGALDDCEGIDGGMVIDDDRAVVGDEHHMGQDAGIGMDVDVGTVGVIGLAGVVVVCRRIGRRSAGRGPEVVVVRNAGRNCGGRCGGSGGRSGESGGGRGGVGGIPGMGKFFEVVEQDGCQAIDQMPWPGDHGGVAIANRLDCVW